jgi:hypothetical protein
MNDSNELNYEEEKEKIQKQIDKMKKRIKKTKYPDKIIVIPNPDKQYHEKWYKGRNKLNIPHPFRGIFCGTVNCGKTLSIKNIIMKCDNPPFEEIYLIHIDGNYSREWSDTIDEDHFLDDIPHVSWYEGIKKTLIILEDLAYQDMNKTQKENLKRLYGYASTHKNLSCLLTTQGFYEIPKLIRTCSNLFLLYPSSDYTEIRSISRKVGLKKGELEFLFNKYCHKPHDSIMLDLTSNSPYPIRLNMFDIIKKNE